jgi:hypothetical protein
MASVVATHEGGHAILHDRLGTLQKVEADPWSGLTTHTHGAPSHELIACCWAGIEAVHLLVPDADPLRGADTDLENIERLVTAMSNNPTARDHYREAGRFRAQQLVTEHAIEIAAIAEALAERRVLTAAEVHQIVAQSRRRAARGVPQPWPGDRPAARTEPRYFPAAAPRRRSADSVLLSQPWRGVYP